ncbi:MAG: thiamine-phosphate kinase [Agarilytica sp.]
MDEFELISQYFDRPAEDSRIVLAGGDDCALVNVPQGKELAFSIDTCIPGRHFFPEDQPENIASRAFRTALSDLAAMGASPLCFTLSLSIPECDSAWLGAFSARLHEEAEMFSCPLVGGDTVRGPLCITLQVQGLVPKGKAITRAGAKPGDIVYVSGRLGDAALALRCLQGEVSFSTQKEQDEISRAYYTPQPHIALGERLSGVASAAIDVSDGFIADLGHICRLSKVGAELDVSALPISAIFSDYVSEKESLQMALYGGDDYQLCFTAPESQSLAIAQMSDALNIPLTPVGHLSENEGIRAQSMNKSVAPFIDAVSQEFRRDGYKHFD